MEESDFLWLQKWYYSHCNGDWEHSNGIRIETIDNPGWLVTINLEETELENKDYQKVKIERTENDWLFCEVKNNKFESACGPTNLSKALKIFRNWVIYSLNDS